MTTQKFISIIVPVYNEALNIPLLHKALDSALADLPYKFEIIFVDDSSRDDSIDTIKRLQASGSLSVRLVEFARNFGKEAAVSAGLHAARGDAAIILDADLQHPPDLIPVFIKKWEEGAEVVVGVKRYSKEEGLLKKASSSMYYRVLGLIASTEITPHATDYRLLDRVAIDEFNRFTERNRMTRGLIDWLGFNRQYVYFEAPPRVNGEAGYSPRKLIQLAMNSFTAYSLLPLKFAGYLGVLILFLSIALGVFVYVEEYMMGDPYNLNITGTAMLAIILLFLIGVVLICLGMVALYIARIHEEVINRPLYVAKRPSEEQE
ncbi:MAG: glycosyltransferase family 2 protein [Candidatus Saccharimonadales bacterium]